jgi:hypothetical protein
MLIFKPKPVSKPNVHIMEFSQYISTSIVNLQMDVPVYTSIRIPILVDTSHGSGENNSEGGGGALIW